MIPGIVASQLLAEDEEGSGLFDEVAVMLPDGLVNTPSEILQVMLPDGMVDVS